MRIIAGKHKGLKLSEFEIESTRPTGDLIREALFDTLGLKTENSNFLDLFAGTGAVGFEALSRNAKLCRFFDVNNECIKVLKKNGEHFKDCKFSIMNMSFEDAILKLRRDDEKFDIVFLDPPYSSTFAEKAIGLIRKNDLLNTEGVIVWEHNADKNEYVTSHFSSAITKKYGEKFLSYIKID